ncbi:hypothetical protein EDC18_102293 [Natranaerovirga pectinivora]|uniref:Uncharacterized protein n=1 Tax=Natranaerovirga pectinivora TaxID=682400 RepID=A0A4R3MQT9_9FIRM|nr:hypothetical protein [Natranaerovirga pectinivora]TCT16276.1 hypothetical protein EDC18_102293 [Natranaerovirga pectinivora]
MEKNKLTYILSVPERTIKSVVSIGTGMTSLLTNLLLPSIVKDSITYRVTFGMLQQFLIEKVAQVEQKEKNIQLKDHYMIRKTAGSIIEGIGLISVRFSPVWMLAILSDISGGSKVYVKRLMEDLKKCGLIEQEVNYENIYDLLEGVNRFSNIGVNAIDMPPISAKDFNEFKKSLVTEFSHDKNASQKMYKALEKVYKRMEEVSEKEKMSLKKLNGAMTIDLMLKTSKKGLDITRVTTKTSIDMIYEVIIKNYMDSLDKVNRIGKRKYLIEHMTPFMKQFKDHYKKDKKTITEKVFGCFTKSK